MENFYLRELLAIKLYEQHNKEFHGRAMWSALTVEQRNRWRGEALKMGQEASDQGYSKIMDS